jgi:hypothetical protein
MMRRFVHIYEDLSKLMWDDRLLCAAKRKKETYRGIWARTLDYTKNMQDKYEPRGYRMRTSCKPCTDRLFPSIMRGREQLEKAKTFA